MYFMICVKVTKKNWCLCLCIYIHIEYHEEMYKKLNLFVPTAEGNWVAKKKAERDAFRLIPFWATWILTQGNILPIQKANQ